MRLAAWRETWMWLAMSACGGAPAWTRPQPPPRLSVFDARPLAGATYVATIANGDFGHPGWHVSVEHGQFQCSQLVEVLDRFEGHLDERDAAPQIAEAQRTCEAALAEALRKPAGFLFLVDDQGRRWLSASQLVAAALPIDTQAKALLVAWASGKYDIGWFDGTRGYGDIEHGIVRAVAGGYEVAVGGARTTTDCDKREQSTTYERVIVFVDTRGVMTERSRVATHTSHFTDACHPMGRRPEAFVDRSSGGTLHGHLARAMHHEAESVRAFERIERELRAHGAPDELCRAAEQAARDERDHADRFARLAGVPVQIGGDALPVRSLCELAIDNAREGCIGEAYAALANVVQARQAETPELRAHYAAIATDELAHAALAHAIAAWLDGALTDDERAVVHAEARAATAALAASFAEPAAASSRTLGLPTDTAARRLLDVVAAAATRSLGSPPIRGR